VFQQAQDDGRDVGQPTLLSDRPEPPDLEPFLDLGDEPDVRVAALAREITANMTNDFEKSLALETWLRQLPYSTEIPLGGGATNLGDWLTDPNSPNYRTGYCEQFATSMAVMARSLGIPTRVVLGFAPGELIPGSTNTVVVTDAQAHAWVEVWLEPNGWTRFDPTPRSGVLPTAEAVSAELGFDISEYFDVEAPEFDTTGGLSPQIARDTQPNDAVPFIGSGGVDDTGGFELPSWARNAGLGLIALLTLIGAVPLLKVRRRRHRSKRLAHGDISAAWEEIVAQLDDLGEPPRVGATPAEAAEDVDPAMRPLATVYARSVYGSTATLDRQDVDIAREALEKASAVLQTRHGRRRHLRALYRLTSLRRRG
jgi:Transglutaminase-like superfamily